MKYIAKREEKLGPEELAVYDEFGFSEKFARLLFIRGIDTKEKVKDYLDFSLSRLHDPFLLNGMQEAVARINTAVEERQRILIIGDYDADGICAVAILYKYFLSRHVSTRYFLPDRNEDGYGLTCDLISKLNDRFKPGLIITVDCGISCHKEIEFAKSLGIDCIVTDHHSIPEITPECICVNPKFSGQEYPFSELCGAGVALKLVHALGGRDVAERYLDICSIATVADIVALRDENRVITTLGLEKLNAGSLPSVTALAKSCNIYGPIRSLDISYKIGPKINASGRMGNAKRGLDIILEQEADEIDKIIQSLTNYNTARQKLCNSIYEDAEAVIERENLAKNNIIIVSGDTWESGVLGIVSARITEKFGKPSIIFGKNENVWKGSGRSIGEVNIVKTIERFSDLVLSFGGHSMAAGLSVAGEKFSEFILKITSHLNRSFEGVNLKADKFYDFSLEPDEITPELAREFEKLEPVGCENSMPCFVTSVRAAQVSPMPGFPNHCRLSYGNMQFVYFNGGVNSDVLAADFPKEVVFEFQKITSAQPAAEESVVRAIVKGVIPAPVDAKSYALTLDAYLKGGLSAPDDVKFASITARLSAERDVFVKYYLVLKNCNGLRGIASVYELFAHLDNRELNLYQFVFCAAVFSQLGIFTLQNGRVMINSNLTTDLFKSTAYNMVREMTVEIKTAADKVLA